MTDRRLLLVALSGALAAMAAPAAAADWRVAASGAEQSGGYSLHLVDRDSVSRSGDRAAFTMQIVYQRAQENGRYNRALDRVDANCRDHSLTLVSQEFFLGGRRTGRNETALSQQIQPGWALASVIDAACSGQFSGERVRDVGMIAGSMFEIMEAEAAQRRGAAHRGSN
jgi:hypothetical protein